MEVLLFQSGYLTIEEMRITPYETIEFKLCIPNKEVKMSLFMQIIVELYENDKPKPIRDKIFQAIVEEKPELLKQAIESIFSSIPYNYYTKNNIYEYEGFYASVVFSYLQSLGFDIIGEDVTNLGRIDITIRHKQAIYVIEFKVGKEDAMEYLKKQNYHQKYMIEDKPIYLIGINFNKESKNVEKYQWEKVK